MNRLVTQDGIIHVKDSAIELLINARNIVTVENLFSNCQGGENLALIIDVLGRAHKTATPISSFVEVFQAAQRGIFYNFYNPHLTNKKE